MMSDEQMMHRVARVYADRLKVRGWVVDKKALRFNDVVAVGAHWERCGFGENEDVFEAGIKEAVLACFKTDPDGTPNESYAAGGPKSMIHTWMERPES
jgi:hypothetical protein